MTNNPYAVERTTHHLGRANYSTATLPEDLVITLVRLPASAEHLEMFVNGEQVGAFHRNEDFASRAVEFLAANQ